VLLDLVLTKREGLVEDLKAGGNLGCSDHEMVEFRIVRGRSRAVSRIKTLWESAGPRAALTVLME